MLWSRKSRAIPLLPLWTVRPVQSLSACTRGHFTFLPSTRFAPAVYTVRYSMSFCWNVCYIVPLYYFFAASLLCSYIGIFALSVGLTPWCRVLLEKLTGLQLVKKFPAFHGTGRFITALTSVRHLSLSWTSPMQSI